MPVITSTISTFLIEKYQVHFKLREVTLLLWYSQEETAVWTGAHSRAMVGQNCRVGKLYLRFIISQTLMYSTRSCVVELYLILNMEFRGNRFTQVIMIIVYSHKYV